MKKSARGAALALLMITAASATAATASPLAASPASQQSEGSETQISPIGVRPARYLDVPDAAQGPAVDPKKGYRTERLGDGLFMVTDNVYQSMFMVYETGVVVVDAPPNYAAKIMHAIREVTDKPVTHLIYSHSHTDHIGGATLIEGHPVIIAQEETKRLLERSADPRRPLPSVTFKDAYTLQVGGQRLELSYHGNGHEPGNIYIYAPAQKTLMFIDVIFPGWMPFRRLAVAQDVPGYMAQVKAVDAMPFEKLVTGHVSRIGTHADVKVQIAFDDDLQAAAGAALKAQQFGAGARPDEARNPWALVADYTGKVAGQCVAEMTPKWKGRLAAFDTYIWDQCYTMEQSLRID